MVAMGHSFVFLETHLLGLGIPFLLRSWPGLLMRHLIRMPKIEDSAGGAQGAVGFAKQRWRLQIMHGGRHRRCLSLMRLDCAFDCQTTIFALYPDIVFVQSTLFTANGHRLIDIERCQVPVVHTNNLLIFLS